MGEDTFDDADMDNTALDEMIVEDGEGLSGKIEMLSDMASGQKRRLLEERLAQRQLEKQIQDYDFELA